MDAKKKAVLRIREFNRFYMPILNLLGNHYLGSEYSPTEARVLFEIYTHDGCNAAYIEKAMNIDKSYLSRIIKRHEKKGYLTRTASKKDSRSYELHLTSQGTERAEDFIHRSNQQISEIIGPLNEADCHRLTEALDTVTSILQECRDTSETR